MKKPDNYYSHKKAPTLEEKIGNNLEIIEKIGEGAFGEVYKVFDTESKQIKVVKKMKEVTKVGLKKEN